MKKLGIDQWGSIRDERWSIRSVGEVANAYNKLVEENDIQNGGGHSHSRFSIGSDRTESDEAWRLYVLENHILQDDESKSDAANYWHKLDDETQDRYLQRIRDSKQNSREDS